MFKVADTEFTTDVAMTMQSLLWIRKLMAASRNVRCLGCRGMSGESHVERGGPDNVASATMHACVLIIFLMETLFAASVPVGICISQAGARGRLAVPNPHVVSYFVKHMALFPHRRKQPITRRLRAVACSDSYT